MKQEPKPINQRIAKYRKLSGHTQQSAADALGIKKNTYARMELHGNPTGEMLMKLSKLYGITVNHLLFGVDLDEFKSQAGGTLHDDPVPFLKRRPPITLTVNEENCVKVCRELSREQRKEIMDLINKMYKDSKNNG